jgi:hypothetical protein
MQAAMAVRDGLMHRAIVQAVLVLSTQQKMYIPIK